MAVLVVAEHRAGKILDPTLEALSAGREAADAASTELRAVLLGHDVGSLAQELASYPVDEVLVAEDGKLADYTPEGYNAALRSLLEQEDAQLVLVPHTASGYEYLPRLAAELAAPLVTAAVDVQLERDGATATRMAYNGKVGAELALDGSPALVTLRPGTFAPPEPAAEPAPVRSVELDLADLTVPREVLGYEKPETGDVDIAEADVIVAVGRGIKEKENIAVAEELAAVLGGVVAGSRPIVDNEWLPWSRQVGSSGKTVSPKLYVACGISGAMQHLVGMKGAQTVVAINVDPTAPIFSVADYGVVGDLFEVVPALVKALKAA